MNSAEDISMKYDYLIVGSGLFGSTFAHEAQKHNKKCLVLERRSHIGGNAYTESIEGINVHMYGAHIFHTSIKPVWQYIQQFAEFNHFITAPIAVYKNEVYNLPFNMNTFSKMWGVRTPEEAQNIIKSQISALNIKEPRNYEEQALSLVGTDVYQKLIKEYTEKQWGRTCSELPAFIIKRLPVRFTYNNNYYNDYYQGIPIGGYTEIINKMLSGCDISLNTDYLCNKNAYNDMAKRIIYTGAIDAYYDYCYGELEYRSLKFETEILSQSNYQGTAVMSFTSHEVPYTRIIEHKHFEFGTQPKTVITKEYPLAWKRGIDPYYPINDSYNQALYNRYASLAHKEKNVIFGGRLGEYKYYDMDKVIAAALDLAKRELY